MLSTSQAGTSGYFLQIIALDISLQASLADKAEMTIDCHLQLGCFISAFYYQVYGVVVWQVSLQWPMKVIGSDLIAIWSSQLIALQKVRSAVWTKSHWIPRSFPLPYTTCHTVPWSAWPIVWLGLTPISNTTCHTARWLNCRLRRGCQPSFQRSPLHPLLRAVLAFVMASIFMVSQCRLLQVVSYRSPSGLSFLKIQWWGEAFEGHLSKRHSWWGEGHLSKRHSFV